MESSNEMHSVSPGFPPTFSLDKNLGNLLIFPHGFAYPVVEPEQLILDLQIMTDF